MAKKEKFVVGIDIGSHAVKVCQIQKAGKDGYQLVALGSAAISPGAVEDGVLQDAEDVGTAIAELCKNLKIKNKERVGLSISGYSVIVKKINIEMESEEELAERLNEEAEQYIPFDINEVYLDFQVLKAGKMSSIAVKLCWWRLKKRLLTLIVQCWRRKNLCLPWWMLTALPWKIFGQRYQAVIRTFA